jgi:hypothetical protein
MLFANKTGGVPVNRSKTPLKNQYNSNSTPRVVKKDTLKG